MGGWWWWSSCPNVETLTTTGLWIAQNSILFCTDYSLDRPRAIGLRTALLKTQILASQNLTNWQLQSYSMPGFAQMCLVVVQARQPLVCSLKLTFCSKMSIFPQPYPWHFATLTSKTKECLLTSQWKYYWTRVPIPALIYPRQRSRLYAKACHI